MDHQMLTAELEYDVAERYAGFVLDALELYCQIEGSEVGEAQEACLHAAQRARNYMQEDGWRFAVLLDIAIRSMLGSEWFQDELGEEVAPHDYYTQALADARDKVQTVRLQHINSARQFGGKYGGAEAEELIKAWVAP